MEHLEGWSGGSDGKAGGEGVSVINFVKESEEFLKLFSY